MSWSCADVQLTLGAYVLGAVDPDEAASMAKHLSTCANCRNECASLASVPAALSLLNREEAEAALSAPPTLHVEIQHLLGRVSDERSRHRRHLRLAAIVTSAALVVAVGGGVFAATQSATSSSAPAATTMTWRATNATTSVSATVDYRHSAGALGSTRRSTACAPGRSA